MAHWSQSDMLEEFNKEFLAHGHSHLYTLLTAHAQMTQFGPQLVDNLTNELTLLPDLVQGCLDHVTTIEGEGEDLRSDVAQTVRSCRSHVYRRNLDNLLLNSGVELFFSFEKQFQFISPNPDHLEALRTLAQFSSEICVQQLVAPQFNSNINSAFLSHNFKILGGSDHVTLVWGDISKNLTRNEFFKWPIPAFNRESDNIFIKSHDLSLFQQEDDPIRNYMLRHPMDFEWATVQETDLVQIPTGSLTSSDFMWTDRKNILIDLYVKIRKKLPVDSIDKLYGEIGGLVVSKTEKLVETLEKVLVDQLEEIQKKLKLNSASKEEISVKIQTQVQRSLDNLTHPSVPALVLKSQGIRFNVKEPVTSFTGRKEYLDELYTQFHGVNQGQTILSNTRVITAIGGTGKSETARKYIQDHVDDYHHIIWIDAESTDMILQNFLNLAQIHLKIPTKTSPTSCGPPENPQVSKLLRNESWKLNKIVSLAKPTKSCDVQWRPLEELIQDIFEIICQHSSLFIFDNAESYSFDDLPQGTPAGTPISEFLPQSLSPKLIAPRILVTSRNPQWPIPTLPLDLLTTPESILYIQTKLNVTSEKELNDLADLVERLPLLLKMAVSCIQKIIEKKALPPLHAVRQYINDHGNTSKSPEFQNYAEKSLYSKSVYLTLLLCFEKIEKTIYGSICLQIMKYAAFLSNVEIPKDFLFFVFPIAKESQVEDTLLILKQFSLQMSPNTISVHRQVQQVILEKLREDKEDDTILVEMVTHFTNFIQSKSPAYEFYTITILNALRLIEHLWPKLGEPDVQKFVHFIADKTHDIGMHARALKLYEALHKFNCDNVGIDDLKTLEFEFQVAHCLVLAGDYGKALDKFNAIYDVQRRVLNDLHPDVLQTLCEIADLKATMTGDDNAALRLLNECYEKQEEIIDQNHPEAVKILHTKAITLHSLKRYDESLGMFRKVLVKQTGNFGEDSPQVLDTQQDFVQMLRSKGDLDDAMKLLQIVLEKRRKILGEDHPAYFQTQWLVSLLLQDMGKFQEALEVTQDMSKEKVKLFGENDCRSLASEEDIAWLLFRERDFPKSLTFYEKLAKKQSHLLGNQHHHVLRTLYNMATVLYFQNKFDEAFDLYKSIHERLLKSLDIESSKMVITLVAMARALKGQAKFSEALVLYKDCGESRKKILGQNHPETLLVLRETVDLYKSQKNFDESLSLLHSIYRVELDTWGVNHPKSLFTAVDIATVYIDQDKCDYAFSFLAPLEKNLVKLVRREPKAVDAEIGLGVILLKEIKYPEAFALFETILKAFVTTHGLSVTHEKYLATQSLLCVVHKMEERYGKALGVLEDMYKKQVRTLGKEHCDSLFTIFKMAKLYHLKEDYKKALELYQSEMGKMEQVFGVEHAIVLQVEETIGILLEKLDRYEEAHGVYDKVYEKRAKMLGSCHPDTIQIMVLKAVVFVSQKKFDEAMLLLRQVYHLQIDNFGKAHADSVSTKEKIDAIQEYLDDKKKGCGCTIV